nr:hypothetical protein Iba_scaffold58146CG0020 [Ipomoea batatas]GMC66482.1 hypothetical protein Iba_chr02eCG6120 [Ipomoea batatas]GMD30778.1 hypothetical protein Iba_chr09aCG10260 [Ipomoea batatas]GMD41812.1 hypothetical protein Iba_chr10bCG3280 [Ipomoea batatas]GMD74151.1 hypothetical protein Iba_chr13aCG2570 [Ipomoea batatas]
MADMEVILEQIFGQTSPENAEITTMQVVVDKLVEQYKFSSWY